MEQKSYETAVEWLGDLEYTSKDNGHNLGVVSLEDAKRAIRLALSTYTRLLNPDTIENSPFFNHTIPTDENE